MHEAIEKYGKETQYKEFVDFFQKNVRDKMTKIIYK